LIFRWFRAHRTYVVRSATNPSSISGQRTCKTARYWDGRDHSTSRFAGYRTSFTIRGPIAPKTSNANTQKKKTPPPLPKRAAGEKETERPIRVRRARRGIQRSKRNGFALQGADCRLSGNRSVCRKVVMRHQMTGFSRSNCSWEDAATATFGLLLRILASSHRQFTMLSPSGRIKDSKCEFSGAKLRRTVQPIRIIGQVESAGAPGECAASFTALQGLPNRARLTCSSPKSTTDRCAA